MEQGTCFARCRACPLFVVLPNHSLKALIYSICGNSVEGISTATVHRPRITNTNRCFVSRNLINSYSVIICNPPLTTRSSNYPKHRRHIIKINRHFNSRLHITHARFCFFVPCIIKSALILFVDIIQEQKQLLIGREQMIILRYCILESNAQRQEHSSCCTADQPWYK